MFANLSEQAGECRLYAELCADKAQLQSDPQLRIDYLEMQRRWLGLARSYEFSERLEFLSAIVRNKELPADLQGLERSAEQQIASPGLLCPGLFLIHIRAAPAALGD